MTDILKHTIVNVWKSVTFGMNKWDKIYFRNHLESMLEYKTTVLTHLWDTSQINAKSIAKNFSRNLWKESFSDLPLKVRKIMVKFIWQLDKDAMFCFDGVDVNKNSAKKMEQIKIVRDGSTRTYWNGYVFHWVSVRWIPFLLEREKVKNIKKENIRFDIFQRQVETIVSSFWRWYWILADRLYDDYKKFNLLLEYEYNFAIRAKTNRKVTIVNHPTLKWIKIKVWKLPIWKYEVTFNWINQNLFIFVKKMKGQKEPIRVISNVNDEKVIERYLKRWEIERIFKSGKQEYNFEKIGTQSIQKIDNLVALLQLCLWISAYIYNKIKPVFGFGQEKKATSFASFSRNLKKFLKQKWKTFNRNSIICFIGNYMKKIKNMKYFWKKPILKPVISSQLCLF